MNAINIQHPSSVAQALDTFKSGSASAVRERQTVGARSFSDVLREAAGSHDPSDIKFSKHALQRLSERDIDLSENQNARLADGLRKANEKGIRDSLVLMDQLAFIVNVPSHTVVTAMDGNESKEKAFTNIDGAVIV